MLLGQMDRSTISALNMANLKDRSAIQCRLEKHILYLHDHKVDEIVLVDKIINGLNSANCWPITGETVLKMRTKYSNSEIKISSIYIYSFLFIGLCNKRINVAEIFSVF